MPGDCIKMASMPLLRMLGIQLALVLGAAFLLARVIGFPDAQNRPPAPLNGFFALTICISVALLATAALTKPARKTHDTWVVLSTSAFLLLWWYVAAYFWINTYGS